MEKLHGIRIALEDTISAKGRVTSVGSKMLKDYIPPFDASIVEKLLDQGAIITKKIDVKEFGVGEDIDSKIGEIIKEDKADVSLGLDASGEMRIEATACGLYALKPTYGRVSRYGAIGSAPSLEQVGIISKNIGDMTKVFQAISGKDKKDSTTFDMDNVVVKNIKDKNKKTTKIGIIKEYLESLAPDAKEEINKIRESLRSIGFNIEEITIPSIKYAPAVYNILQAAEFSSNMAKFDGLLYGYRTKEYKDTDGFYKKNRTEGFSDKVKKKILFGNFILGKDNYEDYYEKSQRIRTLIAEEVKEGFKDMDIIISPIVDCDTSFTVLANLVGIPSLSLPIKDKKEIGLQIMGENFSEELLFKIARVYEDEILNKQVDKERGGEDYE